jgi:hypothetical protein
VDFWINYSINYFFWVNCPEKRGFLNSKFNFHHLYHHTNCLTWEYFFYCMPRPLDPYFQTWKICIQGSGAAGYVVSTTYFLNLFEK